MALAVWFTPPFSDSREKFPVVSAYVYSERDPKLKTKTKIQNFRENGKAIWPYFLVTFAPYQRPKYDVSYTRPQKPLNYSENWMVLLAKRRNFLCELLSPKNQKNIIFLPLKMD